MREFTLLQLYEALLQTVDQRSALLLKLLVQNRQDVFDEGHLDFEEDVFVFGRRHAIDVLELGLTGYRLQREQVHDLVK